MRKRDYFDKKKKSCNTDRPLYYYNLKEFMKLRSENKVSTIVLYTFFFAFLYLLTEYNPPQKKNHTFKENISNQEK